MQNKRDQSLKFIEEMCTITNLSYSALALKARVSPSTINRFVRDDSISELSIGTRNKLAEAAGYKSYEDYIRKENNKDIDFSLLKNCFQLIVNESPLYNNNFSHQDILNMAIELYGIALDDVLSGNPHISIGAAKNIIKNNIPQNPQLK